MRATGNQLIAVNATGCLEVFSTPYPETSWQIPWIHSLFGNAAAVASGVAAAQRVKGRHDVRVVAQGGDGGTTDIGFGCLSGMFERNDDVLYICYDNEAYMNTGVQRSSATPPAARTATTPAVGREPGNVFGTGKNVPLIAMAHRIPYVATASVANLRDLEQKVTTAMEIHGARYIHIHVPCPLGWGSAPADTIKLARLAVESGLFPLFEAHDGHVTVAHADPPQGGGGRIPEAAEALRAPLRHAGGTRAHRADPGRRRPQHRRVRPRWARRARMDKPFAITLDVGSSLANKTGSWRTKRPVYVDRLPPCNHACPAGENIQNWLYHAESGDYEAAWRALTVDNPLPAIMGRVCYHPCEGACNRGQLDEAVGINSVERFLGDEALKRGWQFAPPAKLTGQEGAGGRRGAVGAFGRVSPAPPGSRGEDRRGGPASRAA